MSQIEEVVRIGQFTEIYNLASRASSAQLFDDPLATADINGLAVGRFLEAIKSHSPSTRFLQASSSEVFAGSSTSPQDERTLRHTLSAYGAAKAFADHLVSAYRSTHGLFACSAVLFSHESPRRPPHFLVRKVARAAARIADGLQDTVTLGDLSAIRDWGFAGDYVEGMKLMLRAEKARDYVLSTGLPHTVRDVCEIAFQHVDLDWNDHVRIEEQSMRVADPVARVGNSSRARRELGWTPATSFDQLVKQMVDSDRIQTVEERHRRVSSN